ncbi:MAG TPA: hypothetical protein VNR36_03470 [Pseudolysinimonas sp.]|nr:hypothetical protein [Pseudolysinimonas sp.]
MIDWMAFVTVALASLIAAGLLVTVFSLALRVGDGKGAVRRWGAVALFGLCVFIVLAGIFLIVPALHKPVGL